MLIDCAVEINAMSVLHELELSDVVMRRRPNLTAKKMSVAALLLENVAQDRDDRNNQISERRLAGETHLSLAREFGLSSATITQICARQSRKEQRGFRSAAT